MADLVKGKEPFRFYTRLHLSELTGLRASTLGQLLELIKTAPEACIYHHTHRFLQQHQYLSPEPPNDFAYWVSQVLGEDKLGEELASIDTVEYPSLKELREKIASTIEKYLAEDQFAKLRFARAGEEFHFIKSISFVVPTKHLVYSLEEFVEALRLVTLDSLYFHIFEARLRLMRGSNDFSNWIENSIGDRNLGRLIAKLDPYTYTLDALRNTIINIIKKRMPDKNG